MSSETIETKLRIKKSMNLGILSKELEVSKDYLKGFVEGNNKYSLKDNQVILNGLGKELCLICGKPNKELYSKKIHYPIGSHYGIEINGHLKCFKKEGFFYRFEELKCVNCKEATGYMDNDETLEECKLLGFGSCNGGMFKWNACNFIIPDKNKKIPEEVIEKNKKANEKLEKLLKKAHII